MPEVDTEALIREVHALACRLYPAVHPTKLRLEVRATPLDESETAKQAKLAAGTPYAEVCDWEVRLLADGVWTKEFGAWATPSSALSDLRDRLLLRLRGD